MKRVNGHFLSPFIALAGAAAAFGAPVQDGAQGLLLSIDGAQPRAEETPREFDYWGNGEVAPLYMPTSNAGLFAMDLDGNGVIEGASEFVGGATGSSVSELMALDLNEDEWLDDRDEGYHQLCLWVSGGEPQSGASDKLIALADLGVRGIPLDSEMLDSGSEAMIVEYVDGSIGHAVTVQVAMAYEVDAIAECNYPNPKGTCDVDPLANDGKFRRCAALDEDQPCTNNQGTEGKCDTIVTFSNSFCLCTGSRLSPLVDTKWIIALGAVLALMTGALAFRTSAPRASAEVR